MKKLIAAIATVAFAGAVAVAPNAASAERDNGNGHSGHRKSLDVEERDWFIDETKLPFEGLFGSEASWGVIDGAGYRLEVPPNWNGDLVMWAHGYAGEGLELGVDNHPLREYLLFQGYAWGASSYAKNGYVPGQGAIDTKKLIDHFEATYGSADRIYMTGASMGGHVTGYAIETWPKTFDGAMPICGVMGDSELFDYFQDSYLLAEYFAGNDVVVPTPDDYFSSGRYWATFAELGPGFPAVLNEQGEQYKAAIEQLTGGVRPTFDEGFVGPVGAVFPFIFGQAATDLSRGNWKTEYQLDGDPSLSDEEAMLNELIPRLKADPHYRQKAGQNQSPDSENDSPYLSAKLKVPVLSLHTLGELFVPFHMEQIYAERAAKHGKSHMLVTRAIRDITHCGFDGAELVQAFDDLVAWVEDGVVPAGDAILDPEAVAADDFGCRFTTVTRPGLEPCP